MVEGLTRAADVYVQRRILTRLWRRNLFRNIPIFTLLLALGGYVSTSAELELSGEQDGFYDANAYLVTAPIIVRAGRTLTFAPGSIVRFQRYTGLIVEGSLVCKGALSAPIIFTSVNDRAASEGGEKQPLPFDWNGIEIRPTSSLAEFDYVRVLYSSFGIQVVSPATLLKVTNTVFRDNGNAHFSIGDSVVIVADNTPFSYVNKQTAVPADSTSAAPKAVNRAALSFASNPRPHSWRFPTRIALGTLAAAGGIIWIAGADKMNYYAYKSAHAPHRAPADNPNQKTADDYRNLWNRAQAVRTAGIILCLAGVSGFTITLFF
jgi:hypothetical protein